MNYYEELGIDPSATEEEIARAHRRLARLMHPDQQVDDAVKKLAETQMRRLNAIVDVLTDPGKRRLYDEQLQPKATVPPPANPSVVQSAAKSAPMRAMQPPSSFVSGLRGIWRALPWWVWSTGGALAMTFAISWMFADYSGSSFENRPSDYVRPKDNIENKDQKPVDADRPIPIEHPKHTALAALNRILAAMAAEKPAVPAAATKAGDAKKDVKSDAKSDDLKPAELKATQSNEASEENASIGTKNIAPAKQEPPIAPITAVPDTEHANSRAPKSDSANPRPLETAAMTPTPAMAVPKAVAPKSEPTPSNANAASAAVPHSDLAPAPKASLPAIAKAEVKDPLAGDWVYAPAEPEKLSKGYFPPEFIELRLVSDQGLLHGEYKARYQVKDTSLRPDVNFQVFANAANSKRFSWESKDGRKGVLKIIQVDAKNIEVEWRATTKSHGPALNVGSATLTRRNIE